MNKIIITMFLVIFLTKSVQACLFDRNYYDETVKVVYETLIGNNHEKVVDELMIYSEVRLALLRCFRDTGLQIADCWPQMKIRRECLFEVGRYHDFILSLVKDSLFQYHFLLGEEVAEKALEVGYALYKALVTDYVVVKNRREEVEEEIEYFKATLRYIQSLPRSQSIKQCNDEAYLLSKMERYEITLS